MYFFLRIFVLNPYNYIEPKTVNIEVKAFLQSILYDASATSKG